MSHKSCNANLCLIAEQLRGFHLYISNSTNFKVNPNIVYIDVTTERDYNNSNGITRIQWLHSNQFGRYVTVELIQVQTSLTLCEVEVFGGKFVEKCFFK